MTNETLHLGARSLDSSLLVSVIVVGTTAFDDAEPHILKVATFLQERYAFYEILLIGPDLADGSIPRLMQGLARVTPQVRYLQLEEASDFDRLAMRGYSDCIGDIVVLTSMEELPHVDLAPVLQQLRAGKSLVRLRRRQGGVVERCSSFLVQSVTGLHVDTRFLRTLGLTRELLGELISRPEELSLFRFTARALSRSQTIIPVDLPPKRSGLRFILRRIDVLAKLMATSAPRLLRFASAICFLGASAAFLALAYILSVWLFKANVVAGWTTTSSLIAIWMFVQLGASAVICLGLSRMLDRQERARPPRLVNETSVSDLFNNVGLLNVETAHFNADETT